MKKKIREYSKIPDGQATTIKKALTNLIRISDLVDTQEADPEEYSWYLNNVVLSEFMKNLDETMEYFNTITKIEFSHIAGYASDIVAHYHSLKLARHIKERYFAIFSESERADNQVDTEEIENIEDFA